MTNMGIIFDFEGSLAFYHMHYGSILVYKIPKLHPTSVSWRLRSRQAWNPFDRVRVQEVVVDGGR